MITSASKNVVEIGLSYSGDKIFFFGVNPVPGADVVIKLTAEKEEAVKLSVKGKVGPFWMSVKQYEVTGSPFIYKIHASKPLDQIISKETAQALELGYEAVRGKMKMHLIRGKAAPEDEGIVWQGLLKIKERANLYNIVEDPGAPGDLRRQALQALFPLSPRGDGRPLSGGILLFSQGGTGRLRQGRD